MLDYFLRLLVANYSALYCQYCSLSICQMCFPLLLHGIWKRKKCSTNITSILQDNDGFDFSCFSASLPYLNIYFAMPCTMYLLSTYFCQARKQLLLQVPLSAQHSSLASFAFVTAQCYTPARPVSVMVMLLFSQKIKTVFMLRSTISENYNENIKRKMEMQHPATKQSTTK